MSTQALQVLQLGGTPNAAGMHSCCVIVSCFFLCLNDACDPKNRLGQYEGELKRSMDHVTFIGSTV